MARPCPITREQFDKAADECTVVLTINGVEYELSAKPTDGVRSLGFSVNERGTMTIGGVEVPVMIQANVTCIGSKIK